MDRSVYSLDRPQAYARLGSATWTGKGSGVISKPTLSSPANPKTRQPRLDLGRQEDTSESSNPLAQIITEQANTESSAKLRLAIDALRKTSDDWLSNQSPQQEVRRQLAQAFYGSARQLAESLHQTDVHQASARPWLIRIPDYFRKNRVESNSWLASSSAAARTLCKKA